MSLDYLIPAAFPALILAHFVALLSPGQDFFLISANAVRHGLAGSRFICLGVALGNGVYIAIAILGWSGIRDSPQLFSIIETLGAIYLLWIGIQLLRSQAGDFITGDSAG
ncbi:LysE family translocator, partial [Amphritea sp.]|uniref:LysE family translocator n=1 Tax=Amphritea sp. TaxID=1872502 RepID=UPI003D0967CC